VPGHGRRLTEGGVHVGCGALLCCRSSRFLCANSFDRMLPIVGHSLCGPSSAWLLRQCEALVEAAREWERSRRRSRQCLMAAYQPCDRKMPAWRRPGLASALTGTAYRDVVTEATNAGTRELGRLSRYCPIRKDGRLGGDDHASAARLTAVRDRLAAAATDRATRRLEGRWPYHAFVSIHGPA
jgi:hypothetical protein